MLHSAYQLPWIYRVLATAWAVTVPTARTVTFPATRAVGLRASRTIRAGLFSAIRIARLGLLVILPAVLVLSVRERRRRYDEDNDHKHTLHLDLQLAFGSVLRAVVQEFVLGPYVSEVSNTYNIN